MSRGRAPPDSGPCARTGPPAAGLAGRASGAIVSRTTARQDTSATPTRAARRPWIATPLASLILPGPSPRNGGSASGSNCPLPRPPHYMLLTILPLTRAVMDAASVPALRLPSAPRSAGGSRRCDLRLRSPVRAGRPRHWHRHAPAVARRSLQRLVLGAELDYLWHVVPTYEAHPPFYYSLLKLWRSLFGGDAVALRSLSVLLSAAATVPVVDARRLRAGTPASDRTRLAPRRARRLPRRRLADARHSRPGTAPVSPADTWHTRLRPWPCFA